MTLPAFSDREAAAVMTVLIVQPGIGREALARLAGLDADACRAALMKLADGGLVRGDPPVATDLGRRWHEEILEEIAAVFDTRAGLKERPGRLRDDATPLIISEATFQDNLILTFLTDPVPFAKDLPSPLTPEMFDGRAVVSLYVNNVKHIRLSWLPEMMGVNYYDAIWRFHVYYDGDDGRRHRGVYFLRTDSNARILNAIGGFVKEFKPHHFADATIVMLRDRDLLTVTVDAGDGRGDVVCSVRIGGDESFARGDLASMVVDVHAAFAVDPRDGGVMILEVVRSGEEVLSASLADGYFGFLDGMAADFQGALYVRNSRWRWLPLKKEFISCSPHRPAPPAGR